MDVSSAGDHLATPTHTAKQAGLDGFLTQRNSQAQMLTSIRKQVVDLRRERGFVDISTLLRMKARNERKGDRFIDLLIFVASSLIVSFSVSLRVDGLKDQYKNAFRWWDSTNGYRNTKDAPKPDGIFPYVTVMGAAISLNYPLVAWFRALSSEATMVPKAGAEFLLDMASAFGFSRKLIGIHWNGSSEQLRLSDIETFLPTNAAAYTHRRSKKYMSILGTGSTFELNWDYIWAAFNSVSKSSSSEMGRVNPWAGTLWRTIDEFSNSPVVQEYYTNREGETAQLLVGLYRGGLTYLAMNMNETASASDIIYKLLGARTQRASGKCTNRQRTSATIQGGTMGLGMGCGLGCFGTGTRSRMMFGALGIIGGAFMAVHEHNATKKCGLTSVETVV
jgi:hypothetical protein